MRTISLLFLGLMMAGGCGGGFREPWVMGQDGLYYQPGMGEFYNGEFDHTIDGERRKGRIVNGRLEGLFTVWYLSGIKKVEWTYVNGVYHGRAQSWFDGGLARTDLQFDRGRLVNGTTFKPDGSRASQLDNGTGTLLAYYANGQLHWEKTYQEGKRVGQRIYFPDGSLKSEQ